MFCQMSLMESAWSITWGVHDSTHFQVLEKLQAHYQLALPSFSASSRIELVPAVNGNIFGVGC